MFAGGKVYFLSDRGKEMRFNLYSVDPATKKTERHTDFTEFDIKFPSASETAIVFENAGYIHRFDTKTGKTEKVIVKILEDRLGARGGLIDVSKSVVEFEVSPDGKRALFGARGDVFTVPSGEGVTRNLTRSPGVHERSLKWSPDGKSVAFISDATGEDEVHVGPADGNSPAKAITSGADTYKYEIAWSPDSKKILWSDKKLRLQFVDLETKKVTLVNQAKAWEIREYVWSPDSKFVAFGRQEVDAMPKVHLYSLEAAKSTEVTDGWYSSGSPAFSSDGKYLFFVSARDFNPTYSQTEWNHSYCDMSRIYFVTLAKATLNPLRPKLDDEPEAKKDEKKDGPVEVKVDLDGLASRVVALPGPAANYRGLSSAGNALYYFRAASGSPSQLYVFDFGTKKETALGTVNGYELSTDGKKMLVSKDGKYGIIDLPKGPIALGETLNLSGLEVTLDRRAEWKQMFHACWRQMRDFFYDPGLHGVDWVAVRKKYEPPYRAR